MGDINANILDPDNNGEQYLDVLYECGFLCGIDNFTRVARNSRPHLYK